MHHCKYYLCELSRFYFNKTLQKRVHTLLYDSLVMFGVLGLGHQETIRFNPYESRYEELVGGEKLYRRIG